VYLTMARATPSAIAGGMTSDPYHGSAERIAYAPVFALHRPALHVYHFSGGFSWICCIFAHSRLPARRTTCSSMLFPRVLPPTCNAGYRQTNARRPLGLTSHRQHLPNHPLWRLQRRNSLRHHFTVTPVWDRTFSVDDKWAPDISGRSWVGKHHLAHTPHTWRTTTTRLSPAAHPPPPPSPTCAGGCAWRVACWCFATALPTAYFGMGSTGAT